MSKIFNDFPWRRAAIYLATILPFLSVLEVLFCFYLPVRMHFLANICLLLMACALWNIDVFLWNRATEVIWSRSLNPQPQHGSTLYDNPWLSKMVTQAHQRLAEEAQRFKEQSESLSLLKKQWDKQRQRAAQARSKRRLEHKKLKERVKNSLLLLSHLSHELRTPLNNVIGFAQYLLQASTMPQHLDFLKIIERSGKVLLLLTNDLLDTAHEAEGKLRLYEQAFNLREMLEEIGELLPPQAHAKGLRFAIFIAKNLPQTLLGDKIRIQQILVNLINNAIKFTRSGHVLCRVSQKKSVKQSKTITLLFEITDTGKGIEPAFLRHVFRAFEKENLSFAYGSGLGLYICKQLVQLMKGKISLQSQIHHGTTASFSLPLGAIAESAMPPKLQPLKDIPIFLIDIYPPLLASVQEQFFYEPISMLACSRHEIWDSIPLASEARIIWFIDPAHPIALPELKLALKRLKSEFVQAKVIIAAPLGLNEYCIESFLALQPYGYLSTPSSYEKLCEILLAGSRLQRLIHTSKPLNLSVITDRPILVIDDHPYHLRLMEIFLKEFGLSTLSCSSGQEALKQLESVKPALIFMDIEMPLMDGAVLLSKIRSQYPQLREVPIVALSAGQGGLRSTPDGQHSFDEMVAKPIEFHKIQELLEKHLSAPMGSPLTDLEHLTDPHLLESGVENTAARNYFDPERALKRAANHPDLRSLYLHQLQVESTELLGLLQATSLPLSKKIKEKFKKKIHYFYTTAAYSGTELLKEACQQFLRLLEKEIAADTVPPLTAADLEQLQFILKQTWTEVEEWLKMQQQHPSASGP